MKRLILVTIFAMGMLTSNHKVQAGPALLNAIVNGIKPTVKKGIIALACAGAVKSIYEGFYKNSDASYSLNGRQKVVSIVDNRKALKWSLGLLASIALGVSQI